MTLNLPTIDEFLHWPWEQIEPYYRDLEARPLTLENVGEWILDWTGLLSRVSEAYWRLYVAITQDTRDEAASLRFNSFVDSVRPQAQRWDQKLKARLLESGLEPEGFAVPLRNIRAKAELFRDVNVPLLAEEQKLIARYDQITGAQTVEWQGEEVTLQQLQPAFQSSDRAMRERAWRLMMDRWLADRDAINELWGRFLDLRRQLAANAGVSDFREYRWRQMMRFDYTPEDCFRFHRAIQQVVVPAAERVYARRQQRMRLDTLRPWDLDVDPHARPPLRPFRNVDELEEKTQAIFHQLDPQLGRYYDTMRQEGLLDLENRKGKAAGGYCTDFAVTRRPFIFMNAVGIHDDVQTLLHESGHAFHVFETAHLPYYQQREYGMEIAEVASMAMELLAAPYLSAKRGGFYSPEDAARALVEHLEGSLRFWPYMAVVDAFQHWVYTNPDYAAVPEHCDAAWTVQWERFMPGVDWSGLGTEMMTGWHRKGHIHQDPFYYVDYGLAQLGAVQIWGLAQQDPGLALKRYREALSYGGTRTLPELYAAAGAKLAFDSDTLGEAVELMESTIAELSPRVD